MLVAGFPAGSFQTNCYVVAPAAGEQCVVVDPGQDATDGLEDLLREHRLTPVAVLLTHGHLDHTWSVAPVCGAKGVPAWIHPDDRAMLADPMVGLSPAFAQVVAGLEWSEPDDVRLLADGQVLELAGLRVSVDLTPGHTPGSVVFRLPEPGVDGEPGQPVLLAGDLLFRDGIGRMDLPGGSEAAMAASLARVVLPLPDETVVLPGHGPATTIGRERTANPYLRHVAAGGTSFGAPPRGL